MKKKRHFQRSSAYQVGALLKSTLQSLGVSERLLEQQAIEMWRQVVGPQIAAASRAEDVREGALFVSCKNSMWSNELTLHKPTIMEKLNSALGKEIIKDIHFRARGFRKHDPKKADVDNSVDIDSVDLDESDIEAAQKVAAACESEALASKIKQAVLTSKKLEAAKLQQGYKYCKKCGKLQADKYDLCDSCRTQQ